VGFGTRILALYCAEGRIDGAVKKGNLWLIPKDAARPEDRRRKKSSIKEENKMVVSKDIYDLYEQNRHEGPWPFQSLYENKELFVEIVKHFPYPMHICAPDGTMLLANEAYLSLLKYPIPKSYIKSITFYSTPTLKGGE
jgi:hypothetical protein